MANSPHLHYVSYVCRDSLALTERHINVCHDEYELMRTDCVMFRSSEMVFYEELFYLTIQPLKTQIPDFNLVGTANWHLRCCNGQLSPRTRPDIPRQVQRAVCQLWLNRLTSTASY